MKNGAEGNVSGEAQKFSAKKKTSLRDRSDAISDNSSSKELQVDSSEHLSHRTLAYPNDAAKVEKDTETTKIAARKIINQGGLKKIIETENQAISAIGQGLKLQRSKSSQSYYGDFYEGEFAVNDTTIHLRISTHPATPTRMGNHLADKKISIVVRKGTKKQPK